MLKRSNCLHRQFLLKEELSTLFVSVLVICIAVLAFYFLYFKNKNDNAISTTTKYNVSPGKIKPEQPTHNLVTNTPVSGMLSSEQIKAILKDTTGIIHFQNQPGASTCH